MTLTFNRHSEYEGRHAYLSASKYHWIRYDNEKIADNFFTRMQTLRGTELHAFAAEAIRLGIKMRNDKQTLNAYINDALGFRMVPEQILVYSRNAFGTGDALSFRKERGHSKFVLRIHDLKTGVTPTNVNQLEVYAAFFCLEYGFKPHEIDIELRIYQTDEIKIYEPDPNDILHIMDRTVTADQIIEEIRLRG